LVFSTPRQLLPNRRETLTYRFEHGGTRYFGAMSPFTDGGPAELFLDAGKPGASLQAMARDAAVITSIALQHGVPLEVMRMAVTRLDDGSAAGPLGQLLDLVEAEFINIDYSEIAPNDK
jgi:hypothetical protein